jgi:outer membrane protein assembly factor BamB
LLILAICVKGVASVVALETATGGEKWRALDDTFSYSSPIVITAGGKRQLIIWLQEAVTSLDPATGKTWWRELARTAGDTAVATPVFANARLLVGGLMFQLAAEEPAATVLWPHSPVAMKRILSNTSTALLRGDHVYSARHTGELVCLDANTGNPIWADKTITTLQGGSSIHITPRGETDFLFTDRGDLISARLSPDGYREISRAHLVDPTAPLGDKKFVWSTPAYAHRHIFVRNDAEIVCASLAK